LKIISFDNSKKGIAKNAFLGFVFQFLIKFKGIIILPLVVHFLPKSVLGEWRLITTTVSILLPIITLNIIDGSGMFFSGDTEKRKVRIKFYTIFNITLLIVGLFSIVAFFARNFFELLDKYTLAIILYFISLVLSKLSRFLYEVYQKSKKLLLINMIIEYGGAAFILLLILLGVKNVYTLLIPITTLNLIVSIVIFYEVNREIKYTLSINRKFIKRVLPVSIPLIPVYIAEWLLASVGIYFLQLYFGTATVGVYSVLLSIASLMLTLRATLQFFWFSTCSNMIQTNKLDEFQVILTGTLKVYIFFGFMALVVYSFFGKDLVNILANKNYNIIIKPLYFTALGYVFLVFSSIWNGILYASAKTKKIFINYLITAIVIVLLSAFLIRKFDIMGASLAYMIGNIVLFTSMFLSVKKIKFGFNKREKYINSFLIILITIITILHLFQVEQVYNTIIGFLIILIVSIIVVKTKYLELADVLKIFKK